MYNMNKQLILSFMLICYLFLILIVFYNYSSNNSVSNIICNKKCKHSILFVMILMGILTILYETKRNNIYSLIIIIVLLIGIYGIIYVNDKNTFHYYIIQKQDW